MDLLFTRYADPFTFINGYIACGRFTFFISNFVRKTNEEKEEKATWEFFLHKVWGKSFSEFTEDMENSKMNANQTVEEMETTVLNSLKVLSGFNPTTRKEEQNRTI